MPLIPEPPIAADDTQPLETASPFYCVAPGALEDLEIKLRNAWGAFEQLFLNGIDFRLREDLEVTYKQVVAERVRRDAEIDPNIRFFSTYDKDDSQ